MSEGTGEAMKEVELWRWMWWWWGGEEEMLVMVMEEERGDSGRRSEEEREKTTPLSLSPDEISKRGEVTCQHQRKKKISNSAELTHLPF